MRILKTAFGKVNKFRRQENGLAGVEFALVAPILIALLFGSAALFDMISARRQVAAAADSLADITARAVEIDRRGAREMFDAIGLIMGKYADTSRISMGITGWQYDVHADQMEVVWSRARGPFVHPDTIGMILPRRAANPRDSFARVRHGEMVVVAEIAFNYQSPLFSGFAKRRYRARAMRQPRFTRVITQRG